MVGGPEWTHRSYQHIAHLVEDLNMPALSRVTLADALAHDPCHLLRHPPGSIPRPTKNPRKLHELSNAHSNDFDRAHFGLCLILIEFGSREIDKDDQHATISHQMHLQPATHPMQILAR